MKFHILYNHKLLCLPLNKNLKITFKTSAKAITKLKVIPKSEELP
jgi:hypothetical protein